MLTLPSQPKATKYIVCELATEQASYDILPQSHKSQEKITAHIFHRSCKKSRNSSFIFTFLLLFVFSGIEVDLFIQQIK